VFSTSVIDCRELAAPVAVIGAGPSGMAMAVSLRDRGMYPLLIDEGDVAAS
jgi:cation diffusion facilitator CzcD-associated flavoprotein CzcO